MKRLLILMVFCFSFVFIGTSYLAAQELEEWEWKEYKTKFSVPTGFEVTKNTDTEFEGKAGRLTLSIFAEKGEEISTENADAFGEALGKAIVEYAQEQKFTYTEDDVSTFELNGYSCIGIDAKKPNGDPVMLGVLIDPDYTDIRLYIQIDYKGSTEELAIKIIESFHPN